MPLLHEAVPSFARGDDRDLLYVELGELAAHLIELQQRGETREFPALFAVIERLHLDGTDEVKEAATIGLLEGVQNIALHEGLDPVVFVPYLKPESARAWRDLERFWG
jgi:hypothetical protein